LHFRKLRNQEAGQLLLHLSSGLLGVYVLYIVSVEVAKKNKYACAVVGGLLHYFLLVTFFLMAAEAINLFMKLVIADTSSKQIWYLGISSADLIPVSPVMEAKFLTCQVMPWRVNCKM